MKSRVLLLSFVFLLLHPALSMRVQGETGTSHFTGGKARTNQPAGIETRTSQSPGGKARTNQPAGIETRTSQSPGGKGRTSQPAGIETRTSQFPGDETPVAKGGSLDAAISLYTGKVEADSIESLMLSMQEMGTRFALADNRREVAMWIRDRFVSYGYGDARLDSFELVYNYRSQGYTTWQYNVIAEKQGHLWPDSIHILGGHYDAIVSGPDDPFVEAPGADDNASGVAAVLEVARIIMEYGYEPYNTIQFIAFGAEELGLHGSKHHASRSASRGDAIGMMINNDMISHTDVEEEEWALQIQFYPGSDWLTDLAADIATTYTSLDVVEADNVIRYSDSWPFHVAGYDAVFLHENRFSPFYHSPQDLVERTNKHYAAEMVKVSMGMLVHQNGLGESSVAVTPEPMPANVSNRVFASGDHFFIQSDNAEDGRILEVYQISGQLLLRQALDSATLTSISHGFPAGIYLVRLIGPGWIQTEKVLLK